MSNYCQPESGWGVTLGVFFLLIVVSLLSSVLCLTGKSLDII
jgi:hypothetical protein